ncbi:FtsX-like permease family protein [Micromonospora sp. NPDC049523]|uniref:FtsX-like permease family protein n=1 Tax=Micromonospora sp. NPDC049523 TaxID=3155921 RepID=UPI00341E79E4
MIGLVWSMLMARRGPAVVLLLLSIFATGAAVAGPVYLAAVDRASSAVVVAEAPRRERTVSLTTVLSESDTQDSRFDQMTSSLLTLPGFSPVYSAQFGVLGIEVGDAEQSSVVFREDVCPHLVLVRGRCAVANSEVLVGESTAARRGLAPGTEVTVVACTFDTIQNRYVPVGDPVTLVVVGVYRPVDPAELYWGRSAHFVPGTPDTVREPLFVTRSGLDVIPHPSDLRQVDSIPGPGALTPDRLPALRAEFEELKDDLGGGAGTGGYAMVLADLPDLLDRIEDSRGLARQVVPVAAVPLVALCWFVIFLAVAFGTAARRHELGLVALRGIRTPIRWWLSTGESLLAILLGAPIGFLVGTLGVQLIAGSRMDAEFGVLPPRSALTAALVAVAGALIAGLLAQRRVVSTPVVDLLRRVPARSVNWRSVAVEATVVVLAVVAAFQLRGFDGELVGLSLLVPGLVALAVALVTARLLMPLAARLGAVALRWGRIGPALGLLQLARRPGSQRLFVLVTVAVAALSFAAAAVEVSDRARAERAGVQTGADRALSVLPVDAGVLLRTVRAVDPAGKYAMAVGVLPAPDDNAPSLLLVDAEALPRVPDWRAEFGLPAEQAAARLRTPVSAPFVLRSARAALTVEVPTQVEGAKLEATLVLRSLAGGPPLRVPLGVLGTGRHDYPVDVPGCVSGCRVVGVQASYQRPGTDPGELLLVELRALDSGEVAVGPADFADTARWRGTPDAAADPAGRGLRLPITGLAQDELVWALPSDVPARLPALVAGEVPGRLPGLDADLHEVERVLDAGVLPRVGGRGVLLDLEYAERQSLGGTLLPRAEVWLTAEAPADVVDRLEARGLQVIGEVTAAGERARLARQAPALAVWFHLLAGGFAILLALCGLVLMVTVDRRRRVEDGRSLRRQGLSAGVVGAAARWSYLPVVTSASLAGLLAAGAAWWLAGDYLPIFVDRDFQLTPPRWPDLFPVFGLWALAGVMFTAVAVGLGWASRVRD